MYDGIMMNITIQGRLLTGHSIHSTEDGGLHWAKIANIKADIYGVDFLSLKRGWLATSDATLSDRMTHLSRQEKDGIERKEQIGE
ncbi:MAG: hypothetical protein ACYCVD_00830 [Desulfitobacteriaceae bacterium]